jgi:hypothetical protein
MSLKPLLNALLITKIKINPHVPQSCNDWFDCAWLDKKTTPKRVIDNKNKNKPTCNPSKKPTKNHFVFIKKNKLKPFKKTHTTNNKQV